MFTKNIWQKLAVLILPAFFLLSPSALAGQVWFTSPTNNQVIDTYPGQSTAWVSFDANYNTTPGYIGATVVMSVDGASISNGQGRYLSPGSHSAHVDLVETNELGEQIATASATVNFSVRRIYSIVVANSFNSGNVKVDGGTYSSGASFGWAGGENHTLEAIDGESSGGFVQRFDNWSTPSGSNSSSAITINVDRDYTYTANFKKEFNIVFQNNYPGNGNGGVINVNGTQYSSPTSSFPVRQDNSITGGVVNTYEVINSIEYTFSSWSPGGSTSASTTFTPGDHTTYTANFNAKPLPPPNVSAGGPAGSNVQITWNEHPHPSVSQYQIWRIVKPQNQPQGQPQLLATVNRGITSYTDYTYIVTAGYTNDLAQYDLRAYYSVNGTYSDPSWNAVFVRIDFAVKEEENRGRMISTESAGPREYAVASFPNPFNPSTTISYQLVEDASVTLEIFDVVGRRVATLLNDQRSAGYHSVTWQGKDSDGKQLSSGVYLYCFLAVPASGKEPFRSSGKLVMTK